MSPTLLIVVYCGLILLASLAGGWLPMVVRLTHTRLQIAISCISGLMLGVGLLHLLPDGAEHLQSIQRTAQWLIAGFLAMFFIQRFFHFHHHDVPSAGHHHHSDEHAHVHSVPAGHSPDVHCHSDLPLAHSSALKLTWTGAALGLTLHTLIDGAAIAASVRNDAMVSPTAGVLFGFGTFLVVLLHKPFDAMALGTLMAAGGWSRASRHWVNALFALANPLGVLLFQIGFSRPDGGNPLFLGAALAFSAGTFLCIAASDLLPELQFHSHDRLKLSFALLAGLGLAVLIQQLDFHS